MQMRIKDDMNLQHIDYTTNNINAPEYECCTLLSDLLSLTVTKHQIVLHMQETKNVLLQKYLQFGAGPQLLSGVMHSPKTQFWCILGYLAQFDHCSSGLTNPVRYSKKQQNFIRQTHLKYQLKTKPPSKNHTNLSTFS